MTASQSREQEERNIPTRRQLLHAAGGGLALAASGLLVPAWLEEVDAREGALGGAKGGRRGKDRRGRNKRRDHEEKKDKDKNKDHSEDTPRGLFRGIEFTVGARGGPYTVEFYTMVPGVFATGWELSGTKTVSPNNPITFQESDGVAFPWIEGRYFLKAKNVIPFGTEAQVGLWGHIDLKRGWIPGQWKITGASFPETQRTIEGSRPVVEDDLRYVHFLRRPDGPKHLRFEVLIQPVEA
jgi:hypothetical protein